MVAADREKDGYFPIDCLSRPIYMYNVLGSNDLMINERPPKIQCDDYNLAQGNDILNMPFIMEHHVIL